MKSNSIHCKFRKGNKCLLISHRCNRYNDNCIYKLKKNIPQKKQIKYPVYAPSSMIAPKTDKIQTNENVFSNKYKLLTNRIYEQNNEIEIIDKSDTIPVLYVYKGFLNLNKKYTIDYKIIIRDIKENIAYPILVAYNSKTQKYYISNVQLKYLHKRKCFPNVIFFTCNDGSIPLVTGDFQEFSKLALYGYSVGKNGLTKEERQKILTHIIDNKIMATYEIIEHLQGLICLREERTDKDFSIAINNWKDDIYFINNYRFSKK